MSKRVASKGKAHHFGGDWTALKLDVLGKYLAAYTTALKNQRFRKLYIDAFAGTGYRVQRDPADSGPSLFPELPEEGGRLLDGSARIALKTEPRFDRYIFIERDTKRCSELESLGDEFPDRASAIDVMQGDANAVVRELCEGSWQSQRAVLFLDPYGMNVEWATIEAIAATKAIDLWLLFPLGIGVNRLLTRSGERPAGWNERLDTIFGTPEWRSEFYKVEESKDLFGEVEKSVTKANLDAIGRYFNKRLESIFAGVAPDPIILRNSSNNPLYLFCFAVSNERGRGPALRIAEHLIKQFR